MTLGRLKAQSFSGGRQHKNANLYRKNSQTSQIVSVLYEEKMPEDWRDFLDRCPTLFGVCGAVSPTHQPDDKDLKTHRHIIIKTISRKPIQFDDVDFILRYLNGSYLTPLCITGGVQGLRNMCRYLIHSTPSAQNKEQFDLTSPEYVPEDDVPDNGILNGHTWVYHIDKGLFTFGMFDYWHYVQYTDIEIRERNRKANEQAETEFLNKSFILTEWLDSPECKDKSFLGLVRWCRDNGYFNCLKKDWGFYRSLCFEYSRGIDKIETYTDTFMISTLALFRRVISNYCSTVPDVVIIFVFDQFAEQIKAGISDVKARQFFTQVYSMQTGCVRKTYSDKYTEFIGMLDRGELLYNVND